MGASPGVLHGRGACVVVAGRREARLETLVAELGHERARAVATNVTDEHAVAQLVQPAAADFGRLDIMVSSAGASDGGPAERQELRAFQSIIDLNLAAVFTGCREATRVMLPQGHGSIINIASIAGLVSLSERHRMAGYTASKHDAESAALALTEAVTRIADRPDAVSDELWNEAARHDDEAQLAGLVVAIATINAFNRVNAATRQVTGAWVGQYVEGAHAA